MWNQKQRLKVNHARKNVLLLSLQLEGVVSVGPSSEKFNIVSNDHGRTQKSDFCVSVGKTNLQTITHLIKYMVLEIQFWSVKCTTATVRYAKISSISIPSQQPFTSIDGSGK